MAALFFHSVARMNYYCGYKCSSRVQFDNSCFTSSFALAKNEGTRKLIHIHTLLNGVLQLLFLYAHVELFSVSLFSFEIYSH